MRVWPAASRPGARMFLQRLRGVGVWRPLHAPHTRTASCTPERSWSGYIVEKRRPPVAAWRKMATEGLLQDGEGWTPRRHGQSAAAACSICYRPLTSEQLTHTANEAACCEAPGWKRSSVGGCKGAGVQACRRAGMQAFKASKASKGLLGWRRAAAALPAIASGPARE